MIVTKEEIEQYEKRYRTAFVNSLAGFRQAVLVGTKSVDNRENLAIFNSLIHLGASPALFGLMSRPDTVQRHSYQNIRDTGSYTLNFIHVSDYKKAHQTSARYDKNISEFEKTGFKSLYQSNIHAPFVQEALVRIAMKFESGIPIPLNGTILLIGSILQVDIDEAIVGADGFIDLSAAEVLISQGLDGYFVSKNIGRLPYAKP